MQIRSSPATCCVASPHVTFPALETFLSGWEGRRGGRGGVSHAPHTMRSPRFSFVLRLTTSHVMMSCVRVKHIPGASGESWVVSGPSPGLPARLVKASRPVSPRVRAGAYPRNNAWRRDAKSQELAGAGMIAQARCDNAKSPVSLGFSMARDDNLWACEDWAPPCSTATGAAVRVANAGTTPKVPCLLGFITARADNLQACEDWAPPCAASVGDAVRVFFGGGVIGVFSVVALRALDIVASTGGPPGARASSKFAISSASSSSRSRSCPAPNSASKAAPPS